MSFDYNKWEDELRSEVETHEFAFDTNAWSEMDQLLDQAVGAIAPTDQHTPPSTGKFTPWMISGLLVSVIGLLSWWMLTNNQNSTIALSNFTITITPEKEPSTNQSDFKNAPNVAEAGNETHNPIHEQEFPANAAAPFNPQREISLLNPLTQASTPVISTTTQDPMIEKVFLADRTAAYITPTIWKNHSIPLLPTTLDVSKLELLPQQLQRRRNRRTLYPDVIEHY